jgi:hypothetical protein
MKRDPSYFEQRQPELIYIAKHLNDALRLESLFTEAGLDYGVEADKYRGGIVFQTERVGAFFYVLPEALEAAHRIMREHGYRPREPEREAGQ